MEAVAGESIWTELADGFHDVEMETYLSWRRVSSSVLGECRPDRSDAWVRNCIAGGNGGEMTAAKLLGSVTHTAVFEPDLLDAQYVVEPEPDPEVYTTDAGKPSSNPRATKKWKDHIAELEMCGRTVVSAEAFRTALAMRDALRLHKRARQLLDPRAGPCEATLAVTLDVAGVPVPVKVRPDKLHEAAGINVQFKTTRNAHVESFQWDAWKMGHFIGADLYGRALTQAGWPYRKTCFVVVQNDGFPEVAVYEPDMGMADAAEQLVAHRLSRIAGCILNGWPGLSQEIEPLTLPHRAWEAITQEMNGYGRF